jgi:hypothetical protein
LITNELDHEPVTLCSPGTVERALGESVPMFRTTKLPRALRVEGAEKLKPRIFPAE